MDFSNFLRLIKNNILLLIGVPIILAVSVYFFSRKQPKSYSSETVVYTGIGSGYSAESQSRGRVDYFTTNMRFDNIIKIISSRSTKEQTAIRLLAQHLCLEKANPQYISKKHYQDLQRIVPDEVKDLVVKYGKTGAERDKIEQIKNLENEINNLEGELQQKKQRIINRTQNSTADTTNRDTSRTSKGVSPAKSDAHYHTVSYGESLSSIASLYDMSVGNLMSLNNLRDADIRVGDELLISGGGEKSTSSSINSNVKLQYHTVKNNETLYAIADEYNISVNDIKNWNNLLEEEIQPGQTLVVGRLSHQPSQQTTGQQTNSNQEDEIIDYSEYVMQDFRFIDAEKKATEIRQKDAIIPPGVSKNDYYQTVQNLMAYYQSSDSNFIYELLQYSNPLYSIQAVSKAQTTRVANSDFVKISYNSKDPGVCQQTIKILTNVFISNYTNLRERQTDQVVKYFKKQVQKASKRLKDAESRLLTFNQENNLINYSEQTEAIAMQKESLDKQYQDMQAEMRASSAALNKIESKLSKKDSIFFKSDLISNKRDELSQVSEKLAVNEIAQDYDRLTSERVQHLQERKKNLKEELKLYIDQLYMYQQSIEGVPVQELLGQWLTKTIAFEEAQASLSVMEERKKEFKETYKIFAPLGATLKRIEREINVAEQEYLELLRSLNEARMRQQNLEMTSNIKVVDPPYYPLTVTASRAKILVAAAALIGFILVVFVILVLEYFDASNKTPDRIQRATNLSLAGAYPDLNIEDENIDMPYVINRMSEMIVQNLKLRLRYTSIKKAVKPYFMLIFSTQPGAGKTLTGHKVKEKLEGFGTNVLYLNYKPSVDQQRSESEHIYDINNRFFEIEHVRELLDSSALRSDNREYDYIILEIPGIIHNPYPLDLMRTVDTSILVTKASEIWRKADQMALENFNKVAEEEPMILLNEVEMYVIDELLHGVPTTGKTRWKKVREAASAPFRMRIKFGESDEKQDEETK